VVKSGDLLSEVMGRMEAELGALRGFNDPKGIYARLPYSLDIR
jgi:hypothetical protein